MKTLKAYLYDEMLYNDRRGKFKNKNLTPAIFSELWDISYYCEHLGYTQESICEEVVNICVKCGLKVSKKGVGWKIEKNKGSK